MTRRERLDAWAERMRQRRRKPDPFDEEAPQRSAWQIERSRVPLNLPAPRRAPDCYAGRTQYGIVMQFQWRFPP